MFLTKICIVASGSTDDEREDMDDKDDMLLDRIFVGLWMCGCVVGWVGVSKSV